MSKKINIKGSKLLANNWVITLTATLLGVFVALYLNEWMASRTLNNQKSIATKNILLELSSNQEKLTKSILKHNDMLEAMIFLGKYYEEEKGDLIANTDSMSKFITTHPNIIILNDSTLLDNGDYKYKGDVNLDVELSHINLTTIAWKTLKNSGISTSYGFNCLMYLEYIDKITNEVLSENKVLLDYLTNVRDSGTKNENLIKHLDLLIDYEESLSQMYDSHKTELKDCE